MSLVAVQVKDAATGPNPLEAFDVGFKQRAIMNPPQVNYWCPEGRHAEDMRIHQHLVIEPQDRVIKDSGVKRDAQIRTAENWAVPSQRIINASSQAVAYPFFVAPSAHLR